MVVGFPFGVRSGILDSFTIVGVDQFGNLAEFGDDIFSVSLEGPVAGQAYVTDNCNGNYTVTVGAISLGVYTFTASINNVVFFNKTLVVSAGKLSFKL